MAGFTIFVEGADTEPAKLPVCVVDGEKYATRICEGMKETEYARFDFSFEPWTKSDLGRAPAWVVMIEDAQNGVYGEIVAGICNLAERMYLFMGGRQSREKIASGADTETANAGSPPTAKPHEDEGNAGAGAALGQPKTAKSAKRKRGRPAYTDLKEDKRIYDAWKTGQHKRQADCDRALGLRAGTTYAACERHRKRLERKNKRSRTK